MLYVLPTPPQLRGRFAGLGRLYARPSVPEPVGDSPIVILDNGAWGLHVRGKTWSDYSLRELKEWYLQHGGDASAPWAGVMPDRFLDPFGTMRLFDWWMSKVGRRLGPVLQFLGKKNLKCEPMIAQQIRLYKSIKPGIVFISNPGLRGCEAHDIRFLGIVQACREHFPGAWLHVLGAGWSLTDVRDWAATGVDSIDSIAYYTAAKDGHKWADVEKGAPWKEVAFINAVAAGLVAGGVSIQQIAGAK